MITQPSTRVFKYTTR